MDNPYQTSQTEQNGQGTWSISDVFLFAMFVLWSGYVCGMFVLMAIAAFTSLTIPDSVMKGLVTISGLFLLSIWCLRKT